MKSLTIHEDVVCPSTGRLQGAFGCRDCDCFHGTFIDVMEGRRVRCSFIAPVIDSEKVQKEKRQVPAYLDQALNEGEGVYRP